MIHPDALLGFSLAQKKLLVATYDKAWKAGVAAYVLLGKDGYVPPTSPQPHRRAVALAPALHSVNRIVGEIQAQVPDAAALTAARAAVTAGTVSAADEAWYAITEQLAGWWQTNEWRLNAGESAAWAGEQAGFGEAAAADGMLLDWVNDGDDRVCGDCEILPSMGPLPLEQWPTTPGAGDTECNVGCRCSFDVAGSMLPGDSVLMQLSPDQQASVDAILGRREAALNGLLPDLALLG